MLGEKSGTLVEGCAADVAGAAAEGAVAELATPGVAV
jgi:hypothetical protein